MDKMKNLTIGIDLGGTNLKGVVLDSGVAWRNCMRIPTEADKGGAHVLENILALIDRLITKEGLKDHVIGIGIGTPGFVSEDGTVSGAANLPGWEGINIYKTILERFGLQALAINDVSAMALAEAKFGAGKGVRNMVCYALGTGIGGGIIIDGRLFKGSAGMAGEVGHVSVDFKGITCKCGQRGCVERYASATGIVRYALELCDKAPEKNATPFVVAARKDRAAVTSKTVYDFANQGDALALAANDFACDMLARAIGISINTLSPDRIVLGGGVMKAGRIIIDTVRKHLPRYCLAQMLEKCEIAAATLGDDAGAIGAAITAFEKFGD